MAGVMSVYCAEVAPPREKPCYLGIHNSVNTDDWLVPCSLGIADRVHRVEGEADFVVIILCNPMHLSTCHRG